MPSSVDVNRELTRAVEKLTRIIEATKLLNSTLELSELTRTVLQLARDEVGVERGSVFLVSQDGRWLRSLVAQEVDEAMELPLGSGIAGRVAATGEIIDILNAYEDPRFDPSFDARLGFKTRDVYCLPVRNSEDKIVGVLELLNRNQPFTQPDLDFLDGISVHIGLALERAALHHYLLEKRRIERELDLARGLLERLHPKLPEVYGGVQLAGSTTTCYEVGGDYYSFVPVGADGRFIVAVGDVSGKGISAALVMTSVHATWRALFREPRSLEFLTTSLNQMLNESTEQNVYMTFIVLLVDPAGRHFDIVNAGHTPPLLVDASGASRLLKEGGGPPLGMIRGLQYKPIRVQIKPGTVLVLYTDGVSDAVNEQQESFGTDGLSAIVARHKDESAAAIHSAIRNALAAFVGQSHRTDDATMMVLKF